MNSNKTETQAGKSETKPIQTQPETERYIRMRDAERTTEDCSEDSSNDFSDSFK